MPKKLIGVRVSDVDQELLETLRTKLGASQASVVVMGLRELAKKEGVPIPSPKKDAEKED